MNKPERVTEEAEVSCLLCELPQKDNERPEGQREIEFQNQHYYVVAPLGRSRETHRMVVPKNHLDAKTVAIVMSTLYGAAVKIAQKEFGSYEIYISEGEHSGVSVPGHTHLQVVRFSPGSNSTGKGTARMKDIIDNLPEDLVSDVDRVCRDMLLG